MKRQRKYIFASMLTGSFSLLATFVQVISLENDWFIKFSLVAPILLALISVLFFYKARKYKDTIRDINALSKKGSCLCPIYKVKGVLDKSELKVVWNMAKHEFRASTIVFSTLRDRWLKHPESVIVLYKNNEICGYITIWPLYKKTYSEFVEGARLEDDLRRRNINPGHTRKQSHWYIGSILINSTFRRTKAAAALLNGVQAIFNSFNLDETISVAALAYSNEGEKLLKKYGFNMLRDKDETIHDCPVYTISLPRDSLESELYSNYKKS